MAKINREEYEALKGLDDKWEWIVRGANYGGSIFCFREKPHKDIRNDDWGPDTTQFKYLGGYDSLFQFIQWEDGEPYNIQELIDEYLEDEYGYFNMKLSREFEEFIKIEREEIEVKKDIEWAKNKIDLEVIRRIGREDPHFYVNVGLKMALDFLNQLDEPETLSPDWIGDNVEYAYYMTPKGTYSSAKAVIDPNKLENLLVPKQEKVTVDKEDAENIVDYKEMGWALSHLIDDYGEDARHDELLAKAWLAYPNIEVKEEQKYYVLNSEDETMIRKNDSGVGTSLGLKIKNWLNDESYKLTEQEIKDYDERYWPFRRKVEELEEND